MNAKTKIIYTTTKGKPFQNKKSFFLRCGVLLLSVLTLYVLLTFYNQLRQASQLLLEIKQGNAVLKRNNTVNWRENTKDEKIDSEFDKHIFAGFRNSRNDSEYENMENEIGQAIRRRFEENVYMIRNRFYETRQSKGRQMKPIKAKKEESAVHLGNTDPEIRNVLREVRKQIPRVLHEVGQNTMGPVAGATPRDSYGSVPRETRTNVVIVAYHRSGSSFLGEMFNRDPKAFYLFEPIYTIDSFLDARRRFPILYDTLIRNLLDAIFKCDFGKHPLFVSTLTTSAFRLKSQALRSGGLCDPRATSRKMHLCQRINATLLTNLCRSRPHTVIKTIRMAHWDNLDFLTEQPNTSFKVIHLVRDPRGIIASRVSWLLERFAWRQNASHAHNAARSAISKYVRIMSETLCGQMANDINHWTKRAKLGKPYAMVRYEDVAKEPLTVYKEISRFAGVAQSEIVIGWLKNNTNCTSDPNYYSTTRNSSAVPHMWRRRLVMPLVEEVQNICAEVMGILGYKLVHSERQLKDIEESLVTDWSNKRLLRTEPYTENNG